MRKGGHFCVPLAASLALLTYYVAPLWRDVHTWGGTRDWLYFFFMAEVDRTTVLHYHQFPLWNPYYCGGAVHLANPQTFFLSPTFLFVLLFGTPIGIRLTITTAIFLAFDGLRRLALRWTGDDLASMLAGCLYAVCGTMALHLGGGHVGWLGFGVLPCVLVCFHHALRKRKRFLVYGALGLAWIFGHFGVYPYPYATAALGTYALFLGLSQRRLLASVKTAGSMVALSLAYSAVRLFPMLEFVRAHPRSVYGDDSLSLADLWAVYTDPAHPRAFAAHEWVWPEYGNYVSVAGVALFFVGIAIMVPRIRRYLPLVASLIVFLSLEIGNRKWFPWWDMKQLDLPIIRNLRVPTRFTIVVGMFGTVVVAIAVASAQKAAFVARRWRGAKTVFAIATIAVGLVAVSQASAANRANWSQTFGTSPPTDKRFDQFRQMSGDAARMYAFPRANQGSIACFEESPLQISKALRGNLPADEYLSDADAGRVTRIRWTPNRIVLDVFAERDTVVIVNQNYDSGWRVDGGELVNHQGLLAAKFAAGSRHLIFKYLPTSFLWGLCLTLAALAATVPRALARSYRLFRGKRRKQREASLS